MMKIGCKMKSGRRRRVQLNERERIRIPIWTGASDAVDYCLTTHSKMSDQWKDGLRLERRRGRIGGHHPMHISIASMYRDSHKRMGNGPRTSPNAYFYRFNVPGQPQKNGKW